MESAGVATAGAQRVAVRSAWQRDRIFYTTLPVLMSLAVLYGFSRSYYLKLAFGTPVLTPLFHLHGALFTSWMVLLTAQAALVAARRTPLHRRLGVRLRAGLFLECSVFSLPPSALARSA
jgi:hypothetical protein